MSVHGGESPASRTHTGPPASGDVEQAPGIVWILRGPRHVVAFANPSARASVGNPPQLIGRPFGDVVAGERRDAMCAVLDRVYAGGEPASVDHAAGTPDADGASYLIAPIRDDDGVVDGLLIQAAEVPMRDGAGAAQALAEENARLHRQGEDALAAVADAEALYRALYEENPSMYFTIDESGVVLSVNRFGAEQLGRRPEELIGRDVLDVFVEEDRAAATGHLRSCLAQAGVTLEWELRKRRADGSVMWVRERARAVPSPAGTVVLVVCEDITERHAAEEARLALLVSEHAARRAAERAHDRLAVVQRVTAELSGALAADEVAHVVMRAAVQVLGAPMAVMMGVEDETSLRVMAVTGMPRHVLERFDDVSLDAPMAVTEAIRTRVPIQCADLEDWRRRYPAGLALVADELGAQSLAVVPLVAGRPLGSLALIFREAGAVPADDWQLVLTVAQQCAQALERARLYERERRIARNLQGSLLPRRLPRTDGLEVASRYAAAGEGIEVGGDFYDVFAVGECWALMIGDVCGKGPEAAGLTGLVRHSLRALAEHDTPAQVLERLNQNILRQDVDGRFCTVVYARIGPPDGDGAAELVLARGGHPPALVREPDGRVRRLQPPGALLGIVEGARYGEMRERLRPGATLVLYTDGVTEAKGAGGELFGVDRLERCLDACGGAGPDEVAGRIEAAVAAFQTGAARDDIALLVVRVGDAAGAATGAASGGPAAPA